MGRFSCDISNPGDNNASTTRRPTAPATVVGREVSLSRYPLPHSPSRSPNDGAVAALMPGSCPRQRASRVDNSRNKRRKSVENFKASPENPTSSTGGEVKWTVEEDTSAIVEKRDDDNSPSSPWVLHFCRDVVKTTSAFDEQLRGQLRSSRTSHKLGHMLYSMDVQTYARLSKSNPFNLIKLIHQTLQNVNVHKKACDKLAYYLRAMDDLISPLHKSPELANASNGLVRMLAVLQETLAVAYILVKSCEIRTPVYYTGSFNNIPAKINAVESELRRMIPILHRAIQHHNLHQNSLPIVPGSTMRAASTEDTTSDAASRSRRLLSSASGSTKENNDIDGLAKDAKVLLDEYLQLSRQQTHTGIAPWRLDVHSLTLLRRATQMYTCKACNKLGEGCVYCCKRCDYNVHPECVELNEAIQQLKEISLSKLSGSDS